jgi:hypothetical protein
MKKQKLTKKTIIGTIIILVIGFITIKTEIITISNNKDFIPNSPVSIKEDKVLANLTPISKLSIQWNKSEDDFFEVNYPKTWSTKEKDQKVTKFYEDYFPKAVFSASDNANGWCGEVDQCAPDTFAVYRYFNPANLNLSDWIHQYYNSLYAKQSYVYGGVNYLHIDLEIKNAKVGNLIYKKVQDCTTSCYEVYFIFDTNRNHVYVIFTFSSSGNQENDQTLLEMLSTFKILK